MGEYLKSCQAGTIVCLCLAILAPPGCTDVESDDDATTESPAETPPDESPWPSGTPTLTPVAATPGPTQSPDITPVGEEDGDGDGVDASSDCDDENPQVYPEADEVCDGIDNDCDGETDEDAVDAPISYRDQDGDGFGDAGQPVTACEAPADYVSNGDDCDDTDPAINPETVWYLDLDQDGYGGDDVTAVQCQPPDDHYVLIAGDCNDQDAAYHPGAPEADCEGPNDYNCDGTVGYVDADGDGFPACGPDETRDCDDLDPATHPGADEVCDGIDNDCDDGVAGGDGVPAGGIDEDAVDARTWYPDQDQDGYGDASSPVLACTQPDGTVDNGDDCDDTSPALNPETVWYVDADGDGYGDASLSLEQCTQPGDYYTMQAGDCDDTDPAFHPGAAEDDCADPNDYNCDGQVGYVDQDGDGYPACGEAADCNDTDPTVNPGVPEICEEEGEDPVDNDCNGLADDDDPDVTGVPTWYIDYDGDGYGSNRYTAASCARPAGYVDNDDDCDDAAETINPEGGEVCDGVDNDCDGLIDDADPDVSGVPTWYIDYDGDGYGSSRFVSVTCDAPDGYVDNDADCDDTSAAINPGALEVCDGIDNDCDDGLSGGGIDEDAVGAPTWYADSDGDGYGSETNTVNACDAPDGYVDNGEDCDDTDPGVYPGAFEACDGIDNDCDGATDAGAGGLNVSCAVSSCQGVLEENPNAGDGNYWIDPLGTGEPFLVYCDMTHGDGGWTLVATLSNVDGVRNWSGTDPIFSAWLDNEALVAEEPDLDQDYKSRAYGDLAADELLIVTDKGIWGVWSGLNGLSLMDRIGEETDGCNSWSDTAATLPVVTASVAVLSRNIIINPVDGNWPGHCPFGSDASDSAVLGFSGTKDYNVENGDGLQGVGQSWEVDIKDTRPPTVACTSVGCWEDFVSAYGWEQTGNDNLFIGTVFNNNSPDLEPDVIWLYTR